MAQKICGRESRRLVFLGVFLLMVVSQLMMVSAGSQEDFEQILEPLQTIYDLVKYTATVISGLVMLFAGILYITGGSDPGKREKAKNMIMYVFVGLLVIWAAPFVVELILGN